MKLLFCLTQHVLSGSQPWLPSSQACLVGVAVGAAVGVAVGAAIRPALGFRLGLALGPAVGPALGPRLGQLGLGIAALIHSSRANPQFSQFERELRALIVDW